MERISRPSSLSGGRRREGKKWLRIAIYLKAETLRLINGELRDGRFVFVRFFFLGLVALKKDIVCIRFRESGGCSWVLF